MSYPNFYYPQYDTYNTNTINNNPFVPGRMPLPNNQIYPQVQTIPGRVIQNINEVMPNEIPMDGRVSLFLCSDNSAVYGKYWDKNGQLQTIKFVVEPQEVVEKPNELAPLVERLAKIEAILESWGK